MHTDRDILEEEEEEGEEWVVSVARGVGGVMASVSGAIRKVSAIPQQRPAPRRPKGRNVRLLLRRLAERVAAHERDGWEGLEDDPELWSLIAQLNRAPRRVRFGRGRRVSRHAAGQVIDAEVKEDGQGE